MEKTVNKEILLANNQKVDIQTSTRQQENGKVSTFICLSTDYFRIRISQRISLNDLLPRNAQITVSTEAETDDLTAVETLSLTLAEAIKFIEQLNKNVT